VGDGRGVAGAAVTEPEAVEHDQGDGPFQEALPALGAGVVGASITGASPQRRSRA
jgi:hypothetical protein